MHKIHKVIIPRCHPGHIRTAEGHRRRKPRLRGGWDCRPPPQISRWTSLLFSVRTPRTHPRPQLCYRSTPFFFSNKSSCSSVDGKDIARSYLRPMGTPLQTSWHSATPQTPSLWSVFPAALSVTVWLVLLRSPSPASFRRHLFDTRWLLPRNLTLPSYLAPGYHPYPKVLTQVLTAGRVRLSLLLLWQVQGCL